MQGDYQDNFEYKILIDIEEEKEIKKAENLIKFINKKQEQIENISNNDSLLLY